MNSMSVPDKGWPF